MKATIAKSVKYSNPKIIISNLAPITNEPPTL